MTGHVEMKAKIRAVQEQFRLAAGDALLSEMMVELKEMYNRTPKDTGALRATLTLDGPFYKGKSISVNALAGSDEVDYALIVHENLEVFHPIGQAKYIESVLQESGPYLFQRVAKALGMKP